jgi:inorganic phosphate transporter, PiT family
MPLIGSIIGVGVMNQFLAQSGSGTSGVDWNQALGVGKSLLFSPLIGFVLAAALLLLAKLLVRIPALYTAPEGRTPPPWWIRGLLIFTCTGVSFAHGSNDGQKGMGLIMLILIGTVPTTYALNKAMPASQMEEFSKNSSAAAEVIRGKAVGYNVLGNPRPAVTLYVAQRKISEGTYPSLAALVGEIDKQVTQLPRRCDCL